MLCFWSTVPGLRSSHHPRPQENLSGDLHFLWTPCAAAPLSTTLEMPFFLDPQSPPSSRPASPYGQHSPLFQPAPAAGATHSNANSKAGPHHSEAPTAAAAAGRLTDLDTPSLMMLPLPGPTPLLCCHCHQRRHWGFAAGCRIAWSGGALSRLLHVTCRGRPELVATAASATAEGGRAHLAAAGPGAAPLPQARAAGPRLGPACPGGLDLLLRCAVEGDRLLRHMTMVAWLKFGGRMHADVSLPAEALVIQTLLPPDLDGSCS